MNISLGLNKGCSLSIVCDNSEPFPTMFNNCFGLLNLLSGQNLVPGPPAITTATNLVVFLENVLELLVIKTLISKQVSSITNFAVNQKKNIL
jgi:hypothetical protein